MSVVSYLCFHFQYPFCSLSSAGSVYRDEFDLAILKMQEDNRLEILKRKWWDGGKCPKEEDHRAKGPSTPELPNFPFSTLLLPLLTHLSLSLSLTLPPVAVHHQVWAWRTSAASSWSWCAASWWPSSWRCWNLCGC